MKEEIQFRLGDSVYFPYHGYGTIIGLHNDGREYPIEVRWEASPHGQEVNTFTKDGFLTRNGAEGNVPPDSKLRDQLTVVDKSPLKKAEEMAEESKFKVGDRVFYPYYGMGTVIANYKADERTFPIEVQWDHSPTNYPVSTFYGFGVVYSVNSVADSAYPVVVKWENNPNNAKESNTNNFYTVDGKFRADGSEAERDIYPLKISSDLDEEAVDPMIETPDKNVDDAISPSHYKVKGLPEAIDIINHLMHREQYEGYLWGNILKFAYRYGRKGDKADTAGKIAWYANQLRELGLCESPVEKKEGEHK